MNLLNQIVQGLLLGGYYALLACGLSFMFGVMRIINLAHGSLTVVAAYLLWVLAEPMGWHPLLALLAVVRRGGRHAMLAHAALGRQIRAASEDADTARLVGVRTGTVFAAASAITMVTVTLAGASLALRATFDPFSGPQQLIFAFEAVIIGGAGSLWGTLLGGVVLGVAQNLGAQVHPQGFLIAGHAPFLVILLARLYASGPLRRFFSTRRRAAP